MHYKELCGKPYLSADDLAENTETIVEIEDVTREEAYNPKTMKKDKIGVIKFKDRSLKMVMNVTNSRAIANMFGSNTEKWKGRKVILFRSKTRFGKDEVACLRIKQFIEEK